MSQSISFFSQQSPVKIVKVWDLPVRIFHWLLAALVVTAGVTGQIGGDAMEIHVQAGYGIAVLVAFRLAWGLVGTHYARFGNFVRGIPSALAYCRQLSRGDGPRPGHNPLGGWMVVLLLALLAFQAGTGLFANDDILTEGPLFNLVTKDTSDYLTALHKLGFKVLAALVGLHLLAIALYRLIKGVNLVAPMITGRMGLADPTVPEYSMAGHTNILALVLLAATATGFYLLMP